MAAMMDVIRGLPCDWTVRYGWLILLEDGNRIDLHVHTWECTLANDLRLPPDAVEICL